MMNKDIIYKKIVLKAIAEYTHVKTKEEALPRGV